MSNDSINKAEAKEILWKKGILRWKLDANQKEIYKQFKKCDSVKFVLNCSRRLGKCRKEGSLVATPNGPVEIQNLKPGDKVYGYDHNGKVSLTNVVAVEYMGEKDVVDLTVHGKIIESCTPDHRFLTASYGCSGTKERKVKDFYKGVRIKRNFYDAPCGNVSVPDAYALGALLGDGCSKERGHRIKISSENDIIPKKVANVIGVEYCYKNSAKNNTWILSTEPHTKTGENFTCSAKPMVSYYKEWCENRKAHEKIIDWEIVNKWDRESCLNLLAGLIDTDGSVGVNGKVLTIQFGSQSLSMITAVQKLVYKLWQYRATITKDKRDKYVNGPYYQLSIRNNLFSKRIIKELDSYLVLDRKKWKNKYKYLKNNNSNLSYVGPKISKPYKAKTWDIQVDNKTSLYLTGDGLVTHNSYMLCITALEYALSNPRTRICYASDSAKSVKNIILPIMEDILADCPEEVKPKFKRQEQKYEFKNGSIIDIAGADAGRADALRGRAMDLGLVDEAGFITDLVKLVQDILMPQTMGRDGRIIMASTPPESPSHPFVDKYIQESKRNGSYVHKTIYDNPRIGKKELKLFMKETDIDGKYTDEDFEKFYQAKSGPNNTTWRREYMAEIVTDETQAVLPGFTEEVAQKISRIVVPFDPLRKLNESEIMRPEFFDAYVWMDVGHDDNTGILFGYWDFPNAKIVIEDEELIHNPNHEQIVELIRQKEQKLWLHKVPYKRVADANSMDIAELTNLGLSKPSFVKPPRESKDASVNILRTVIGADGIFIHPRCVRLKDEMMHGVWNSKRNSFKRNGSFGHFDLLDTLVYAVRTIDRYRNPTPKGYGLGGPNQFVNPRYLKDDRSSDKLVKSIVPINFRPKKGR